MLSLSQFKTFTPPSSSVGGSGEQSSAPLYGMHNVLHISRITMGPAVAVSAKILLGSMSGNKDLILK